MHSDDLIKHMTERFLSWKLPENFRPDAGISFTPEFNVEYMAKQGKPPMRHEPTGTNLFDYTQASAMVRHMLDGFTPPTSQSDEALVELRDVLKAAFIEGAEAVHGAWLDGNGQREADFGEAGDDYAASVDLDGILRREANQLTEAKAKHDTIEAELTANERMVNGLQAEVERQEGLAKIYRQAQLSAEQKLCREQQNSTGWKKRSAVLERQLTEAKADAERLAEACEHFDTALLASHPYGAKEPVFTSWNAARLILASYREKHNVSQ